VIELDDVERAAARLRGVAHRTPVLRSAAIDALAGAEVFIKAECFQRTGSFKFRGAYNALAALPPQQRRRGVVTGSSGNHAAAVALAARLFGVAATVVMPEDAPANKRAATEGYGATVVGYDRYREDRDVLDRCTELGIGFLPWSPLGGSEQAHDVGSAYAEFANVGDEVGATAQEVVLAWLLATSPSMLPIPGASRPATVESIVRSVGIALSPEQVARLDATEPRHGSMYPDDVRRSPLR